jgi:hypothetical protein
MSLSSLVELGLTILLGSLRPVEEPKQCSIFSNRQHFAVYVGRIGVACPLPAFGVLICPCCKKDVCIYYSTQLFLLRGVAMKYLALRECWSRRLLLQESYAQLDWSNVHASQA